MHNSSGIGGAVDWPVSQTDVPSAGLGVRGLKLACHPALVPWIRDQRAQGTKTHCLHKMHSIINAVYRAIRGSAEAKEGNKEMGTEERKRE